MNPGPSNCRSSADQASIYTQGGTRIPAVAAVTNAREVAAITRETRALIASLAEYLKLVNDEFKKPQSHMAGSIAMGLRMAEYTIHSLQRHVDQVEAFCRNPEALVDAVRGIDLAELPTYVSLFKANPAQHRERQYHTGQLDLPGMSLKEAGLRQKGVLEAWNTKVKRASRVTPAIFAGRGWHEMQKGKTALLCHQPASNRPHLPLEVMHAAFYEFVVKAELDGDKLANFHAVAEALCRHVTDPLEREKDRASLILQELEKAFPNDAQTRWDATRTSGAEYHCYRRFLPAENCTPRSPRDQPFTNLIIVKVKLEAGENGDAFMHVARYYGNTVEDNPRSHETGSPTFLVTISGMFISDMCICLLTIFFEYVSRAEHQILWRLGR
jgi:hypothetical protein